MYYGSTLFYHIARPWKLHAPLHTAIVNARKMTAHSRRMLSLNELEISTNKCLMQPENGKISLNKWRIQWIQWILQIQAIFRLYPGSATYRTRTSQTCNAWPNPANGSPCLLIHCFLGANYLATDALSGPGGRAMGIFHSLWCT